MPAGWRHNQMLFRRKPSLKATQAQEIDIGVQRSQLEHAIALLIGKPASDFSHSCLDLAAKVPVVPAGLPSEILERRPDIAAAERTCRRGQCPYWRGRIRVFPNPDFERIRQL